jgi:hypothetical protein
MDPAIRGKFEAMRKAQGALATPREAGRPVGSRRNPEAG